MEGHEAWAGGVGGFQILDIFVGDVRFFGQFFLG
jgi:hypothetical protein